MSDPSKKYNTKLTDYEEAEFQRWLLLQSLRMGRNLAADLRDYDVRGLWSLLGQSGANLVPGHGTDQFKKPNHPTFSTESQYSTPQTPGGAWLGQSFIPSAPMANDVERMKWLAEYMNYVEPGVALDLSQRKAK